MPVNIFSLLTIPTKTLQSNLTTATTVATERKRMKLKIELTADDIKRLVTNELEKRLGDTPLDVSKVVIQTRSKQNYKAEWEQAEYRVSYEADI